MDAKLLNEVEQRCKTMDFKTATNNISRDGSCFSMLISYPSILIQSRLEFDHITSKNLNDMTPLQILRISTLKRELMKVLQDS